MSLPQVEQTTTSSDSGSTASMASLSSAVKAERDMSALLHYALGDRDKYYQYLLGDDCDIDLGKTDFGNVAFEHYPSNKKHSSRSLSPTFHGRDEMERRLREEQEENSALKDQLNKARAQQACSDIKSQELMLEVQGLKLLDHREKHESRVSLMTNSDRRRVSDSDFQLPSTSSVQCQIDDGQRRSPSNICGDDFMVRSTGFENLQRTPKSNWAETVQALQAQIMAIKSDSKREIMQLSIELKNKDDERLMALRNAREMEIEMQHMRDAEASMRSQINSLRNIVTELQQRSLREMQPTRLPRGEAITVLFDSVNLDSFDKERQPAFLENLDLRNQEQAGSDRDCRSADRKEGHLRISPRGLDERTEAHTESRDRLVHTLTSLARESESEKGDGVAVPENDHNGLVPGSPNASAHTQSRITLPENNLIHGITSSEAFHDLQPNSDAIDKDQSDLNPFFRDTEDALNAFDAKVESILESMSDLCEAEVDEHYSDDVSNMIGNPLLTQCESVVQALTYMLDKKKSQDHSQHDSVVVKQLELLSGLLKECDNNAESKHDKSAKTRALTLYSLEDDCIVDSEEQLSELQYGRTNRCGLEAADKFAVAFAKTRFLKLSEVDQRNALKCLSNPVVSSVVQSLHDRCETLEKEQTSLITETVHLLESTRQSHAAAIEATITNMQRQADHRVWLAANGYQSESQCVGRLSDMSLGRKSK